jgi:predicted anti-sigma-YlaC factor YlaD
MKCEECLQSLELFFDDEADDLTADRISKHIAGCDACARAYDNLCREQEFFRRHEYNVEAPGAFWDGVSARIADEKAARAGWSPRTWQMRLSSLADDLHRTSLQPRLDERARSRRHRHHNRTHARR